MEGADFLLAIAVGDRGRPREAAGILAGIVRRRRARWGPRHPETPASVHQWAFFTGEAGDTESAVRQLTALLEDRTRRHGRARQELDRIVEDARRVLEPGHRHLALAHRVISRIRPR
ncbi:hypothetical protein [Streptomyces sp. bgisy082]|uniref:hypothetical protein n=1 Tax=Streptomyces sp. bgisy082 TaxID=3413776 RepID=UPI003D75D318